MRSRVMRGAVLGLAFLFLTVAVWPLTSLCSGRPLGRDCESWLIFGVNLFGPFGLVALFCWAWSARTASLAPHVCWVMALIGITSALAVAISGP